MEPSLHYEGNGEELFASRVGSVPRSFLREILKTARAPGMISFAGGLPNEDLFPVEELRMASDKVLSHYGRDVLQYGTTEGVRELREFIADRYLKRGVRVSPENILMTSGSQQALDLLGKVFVNEGDRVVLEEPSYLGAIQALSLYRPEFVTVPLCDRGLDTDKLREALLRPAKLLYAIPNFQNPTGLSYSEENRYAVAEIIRRTATYLIEDDPYGELRFVEKAPPSFGTLAPENAILLGSFSKTLAPGLRLGWVVLPASVMERVVVAKQATDLHTSSFAQRLVFQYLADNDYDAHISKVAATYSMQKNAMVRAIGEGLPRSVSHTDPEGGMFLWGTLPDNMSALKLSDAAIKNKVCVVPGHPFYIGKKDVSTFRLSFSNTDEGTICEGVKRLAKAIESLKA